MLCRKPIPERNVEILCSAVSSSGDAGGLDSAPGAVGEQKFKFDVEFGRDAWMTIAPFSRPLSVSRLRATASAWRAPSLLPALLLPARPRTVQGCSSVLIARRWSIAL